MQILYAYDDLDRMTEIERYIDGVNDEILMDSVQYNVESLLTQFDYGSDLQATFTHDSMDRPLTIDIKNGETSYLDLDYTFDESNNITQLVNGWRDTTFTWHSDTESYSYDGLNRLTSASCTPWSHIYSYDKVGNIAAKDSVTHTLNAVNEVTALSDGTSFTYDSNGNRTQKTKGTDTWGYTYDYANRLTEVEKNSETLGEYGYDGDGRRIQVTESSVTTTYIYGGLNVLYEENTTGTAAYIYGPTGTLAKRTTINQESNIFYYHPDHLGSTRLVTDKSKNIVVAVTYHPFGESDTEECSEDYLFTGKERDATGLYYFGARYYDPELGRFLTRDPLIGIFKSPQTLNRYTYCLNNPLKFIDPAGLRIKEIEEEVGEVEPPEDEYPKANDTDPVLTIQLDEDSVLTMDIYVQEGNVLVGYGTITNTGFTSDEPNFELVFVVIVFNDDGSIEKYDTWNEDDLDGMYEDEEKLKEFADELKDFVGEENCEDLELALEGLYRDVTDLADDESLWEQLAKSAGGSGAGAFLSYLMPGVGTLAGGIVSILFTLTEHYKWYKRQTFLGHLLIFGIKARPE